MKKSKRFVPIEELKELYKQREEIDKKISSYNPHHCKYCGDTNPKNHFVALLSYAYPGHDTSGLTCNKCASSFNKKSKNKNE